MRYPAIGGFKAFLNQLVKGADIRYDQDVVEINPLKKQVKTSDGNIYTYSRLISSMPLPILVQILEDEVPNQVKDAAKNLRVTSGYTISVALKGENTPDYLW